MIITYVNQKGFTLCACSTGDKSRMSNLAAFITEDLMKRVASRGVIMVIYESVFSSQKRVVTRYLMKRMAMYTRKPGTNRPFFRPLSTISSARAVRLEKAESRTIPVQDTA
jgi:hypothetical protein